MDQPGGEIDVSDLFNEENLNNAALGGGILSENAVLAAGDSHFVSSSAQTEYVADLSVFGSLTKLMWAKTGVVAQITENGMGVETTSLRFDARTFRWTTLKPKQLEAVFEDAIALAWNSAGAELAVLDKQANVHLVNVVPTAVNRFHHSIQGQAESTDESNQPIGMLWLNLSRGEKDKKKTVLENCKENGKWRHEHIEGLPYPPYALRALCMVGRNGTFTLVFTRDAGPYKSARLLLPLPSSSPIYTHAAISQTQEGRLIVALHEIRGHISTYFVDIAFSATEPLPNLTAEIIDPEIPSRPPYMNFVNQTMADLMDECLLTHLHIIPESEYSWEHLDKPHLGPKQPPTLIAIYASYSDQKDAGGNNYFGSAIVKRWQFQRSQFELHSRFANGPSTTEAGQTVMQPLADVTLPAAITSMQMIEPGNALAMVALDGSTIFYDPNTMQPISTDPSSQIVSSIANTNLEYSPLIMSTMQYLSSHAMAMVYTDMDDKLAVTQPKYGDPITSADQSRDLDVDNTLDDAVTAGYILAFSRSVWQSTNFDDIVLSIQSVISASSLVHIRRQLFLTLFQPKHLVPGPGSVSEVDKVPHSIIIYKALAFHFGLFKLNETSNQQEKIAYLWAWTVLNLKWCTTIIGDTYKSMHQQQPPQQPNAQNANVPRPPQAPTLPSTFLDVVSHNIRWVFSLYTFILQSILNVHDRSTHPQMFDPPSFWPLLGDLAGTGSQGFVALLLTCTWSRSFLLIMARLMKACANKAQLNINFRDGKASQSSIPGNLNGTTLGRVAKTIQACSLRYGITVNALEMLFDPRFHPDGWKMGDEAANQATLERQVEMMVTGYVSESYQDVVKKVLDGCVNGENGLRARGEIDRLRLSEECPGWGEVFLNMDDIAFRQHEPKVAMDGTGDGISMVDDGLLGELWSTNTDVAVKSEGANGVHMKRNAETKKPGRVLYDVHKKLPLFSHQSLAINPPNQASAGLYGTITTREELLSAQVRRCVRCGSVSDGLLEGTNKTWPRQVSYMMNKCVCDGNWIVEAVGEGLVSY